MRRIVTWIGTITGFVGAALSKANLVANHLGFLSLPDDMREALIVMSHIPMLLTSSFLIVGIGCLIFLIHDYGLDRALLQWANKTIARIGHMAAAPDDLLSRVIEIEDRTAQNKASLEELRTRVTMLTRSLRARDALSIIKEADQVVMPASRKLLEESYANEPAWVADWERAMTQIDSLWPQWQPHDKRFLDIHAKDFERSALSPPSNIAINVTRYMTVGIAQQRYADMREGILQFLDLKARDLPG